MPEKLFTIDEVAEFFKLSRRTVQRYMKEGKIKYYKFDNEVRISEEQIAMFLDERLVSRTG